LTLLTIIQDTANEVGIDAPVTVIGNTDNNTARLLALSIRGGKAIAQRFPFQELVQEWTFTTVAAELQGTLEAIMPGFNYDLYETIWNRSTKFPVQGPLFPQEWEFLKALNVNGPYPQFTIRGGNLLCLPIPPAGQTLAGQYVSRFWCQSATGTGQDRWLADTDKGTVKEDLLTLDLVWRWKSSQGLDYGEEKQEFEIQINNAMSRSGSNRVMNLAEDSMESSYPNGVAVQIGNWPLS
jgi:hypothetical protein